MAASFTPARVVLFLLLCLVGLLLVYGIFSLLMRARTRQTIVPHSSRIELHAPGSPGGAASLSASYA